MQPLISEHITDTAPYQCVVWYSTVTYGILMFLSGVKLEQMLAVTPSSLPLCCSPLHKQVHSKVAAKTGNLRFQWQIMRSLGLSDSDIKE